MNYEFIGINIKQMSFITIFFLDVIIQELIHLNVTQVLNGKTQTCQFIHNNFGFSFQLISVFLKTIQLYILVLILDFSSFIFRNKLNVIMFLYTFHSFTEYQIFHWFKEILFKIIFCISLRLMFISIYGFKYMSFLIKFNHSMYFFRFRHDLKLVLNLQKVQHKIFFIQIINKFFMFPNLYVSRKKW